MRSEVLPDVPTVADFVPRHVRLLCVPHSRAGPARRASGRLDAFLAELSAEGHYAASDNEAIVRAVALLPRARATDLLVRIVRRNAPARLGACGDLLRRYVAAPAGSAGEPARIGAALLDVLPGDPAKPAVLDIGQRPASGEDGIRC
jgi:hypothetical protein